jgi:hypothetical protein
MTVAGARAAQAVVDLQDAVAVKAVPADLETTARRHHQAQSKSLNMRCNLTRTKMAS